MQYYWNEQARKLDSTILESVQKDSDHPRFGSNLRLDLSTDHILRVIGFYSYQ